MKKVLICYASIGSGHRVAAEAIGDALSGNGKVAVQLLDTRASLRGIGRRLLPLGTAMSQGVLMHAYDWLWNSEYMGQLFVELPKPARVRQQLMSHYFDFRPDVIVCTHNFPCCVFSQGRDLRQVTAPLVAVATDLQVHPYWPLHNIEHFMVASSVARTRLLGWGLSPGRITVAGIPLRGQFAEQLSPRHPVQKQIARYQALVIAGGGQITPYVRLWPQIIELALRLRRNPLPMWQWTFITGDNMYLAHILRRITKDSPQITVLGYVNNMAERLASADVVLTKPGGLTVAECLALHKPMILLSKGAGQEAANTLYLTENGAALLSENASDTIETVRWLFANGLAESMKQKAKALAHPGAAEDIAAYVLELLGEGTSQPCLRLSARQAANAVYATNPDGKVIELQRWG